MSMKESNIKVAIKAQSLASKVMIKSSYFQHIWLSPTLLHILGRDDNNNNNNKEKGFLNINNIMMMEISDNI